MFNRKIYKKCYFQFFSALPFLSQKKTNLSQLDKKKPGFSSTTKLCGIIDLWMYMCILYFVWFVIHVASGRHRRDSKIWFFGCIAWKWIFNNRNTIGYLHMVKKNFDHYCLSVSSPVLKENFSQQALKSDKNLNKQTLK